MNENIFFPYNGDLNWHNEIKQIFSRITDNVSMQIFTNRLLFSCTNDFSFIRKVVDLTETGQSFSKRLTQLNKDNNKFIIYGAGIRGTRLKLMYPEINWIGYIDKYKSGSINKLPILPLEEVIPDNYTYVIISNEQDNDSIIKVLTQLGFPDTKLIPLEDYEHRFMEKQYFDKRCLPSHNLKSFVDIGCYNGMDSIHFRKWSAITDPHIYAFEPDRNNYLECQNALNDTPNIKIFNMGLSNRQGTMSVSSDGYASNLSNAQEATSGKPIKISTLDMELPGKEIDYIKMDVEGMELPIIHGAKNIIKSQKPYLAISIYHKREDIIALPAAILEICDEYTFALGHYDMTIADTVLYAIPK
ncbi:FkbM family methyltransferase [Anaerovibrio lipolyticus]|uniref:FkbM family methyltransferase n=1 Tax=Anaerovibrio lipolyticus TaxID=82374 RepID=UPI0026E9BCC4|nr:FkbM family methyltransferase [Anaerovibrio lipolyticus]